jgi:hypothetical protein
MKKGVYLTHIFGYTNLANSNSSKEGNGRCSRDVNIRIPLLVYIHATKREYVLCIGVCHIISAWALTLFIL